MDNRAHAAAAEWFVRLHDARVSVATRAEFAEWLLLSPDHIQAYLDITRAWGEMDASTSTLDAEELIRSALADKRFANVVPLGTAGVPNEHSTVPHSRRRRAVLAGVGILCALVLIALWFARGRFQDAAPYRTEIAEQRSLLLADGTLVMINTDSLLLMYRSHPRRMTLERGEAQLNVSPSTTPFIAKALRSSITTQHARFNLRVSKDTLAVGVLDGSVEIRTGDSPSTHLQTGQRLTVTVDGAFAANAGPPLSYAQEWPNHRLVFRDQPLSEVVAELSRYHRTKLRIRDAEIASQRITATFDTHDLESFVQFVTRSRIARVEREDDGNLALVSVN